MRNMSWSLVELPNPLTEEPKGITWSGQVKETWWKVVFLTSQENLAEDRLPDKSRRPSGRSSS